MGLSWSLGFLGVVPAARVLRRGKAIAPSLVPDLLPAEPVKEDPRGPTLEAWVNKIQFDALDVRDGEGRLIGRRMQLRETPLIAEEDVLGWLADCSDTRYLVIRRLLDDVARTQVPDGVWLSIPFYDGMASADGVKQLKLGLPTAMLADKRVYVELNEHTRLDEALLWKLVHLQKRGMRLAIRHLGKSAFGDDRLGALGATLLQHKLVPRMIALDSRLSANIRDKAMDVAFQLLALNCWPRDEAPLVLLHDARPGDATQGMQVLGRMASGWGNIIPLPGS